MRLFSAADFSPVGNIPLGDDADNVRIDPRNGLAVVGYGSGGLAVIDPASRAKLADIRLPAHPEGFQIDPRTGRAYVNVPDARQIAVVDLDARRVVATWPTRNGGANFPMALDPAQSSLASVFRSPPSLQLLDTATGAVRQILPVCGDADDVFFDPPRMRIYVSCGAGEIDVFHRVADWQAIEPVRTASGARTSLFAPQLDRLFVAERAGLLGSQAAIRVYPRAAMMRRAGQLLRSLSHDAYRILIARGLRAFADGFVALLLPIYLVELGFSPLAIGSIVASTLIGTALLTLWIGSVRTPTFAPSAAARRRCLMAATGLGFAFEQAFWPLLVVAFVGTMNPTSGDASIFLPLEQTVLAQTVDARRRTALFAHYSVIGSLAGAVGVLAAAIPDLSRRVDRVEPHRRDADDVRRCMRCWASCHFLLYRPLSPAIEAEDTTSRPRRCRQSRRLVYGLAALFGMDSFGTGFLVQSLLALWLYQTFQISVPTAAAILFWSSICSAVSYLIAVPIAERIGLINTMVFTHLPSNVLLVLIPFAPDLATAIGLLLAAQRAVANGRADPDLIRHGGGHDRRSARPRPA